MQCTRLTAQRTVFSKQATTQLLRALNGSSTTLVAKPVLLNLHNQHNATITRPFSTTRPCHWKEIFPQPDSPSIKETPTAWTHPIYTAEQMRTVVVAHRNPKDFSDRVALTFVRVLRWGLDLATGYRKGAGNMTARQYMIRNVFLESVAGVPGMVAGMLRHLHSMRRMKRDNGWIETLLEESFNERMHLLTFLKMAEPGWFMRVMVLGAQGVFFNAFFISYLLSPRTCHRFVGHLEEEAVLTYTREIADIDAGLLPEWDNLPAPDIAVKYWSMPEGSRTMRDLLLYIRADESKHREVNHTLGNLDQKLDVNPYNSVYKDEGKEHPVKDLRYQKPTGWEREEVI
ncbi:unnamed protein product [Zymoseptoria tritici ST99CH_3D1]|uniref:Alternative oxidase n=2 Tax=Zymoseptoria tritici TaxID=1047171 RepID=F9XCX9_ZYMTI|nr:uncharacterized protein MYCGRDRAFT_72918 [Zymoseptoria tritici IPO323]EGP86893.1 hypothetical protein MYCGRDRAFT_72918 [Zymoseptoria tritici IPO323]SMQ51568.1 unnamed protein product [Zymoseptoria tritici ST99CH_3D7]SMR56029.1 unnamed protein product [Zymoseptoria tritici ST99CH_3D1]